MRRRILASTGAALLIPALLFSETPATRPAADVVPLRVRHRFSAAPLTERPFYYDHAVTPSDIDGRSLREIGILRNWIFARAGNRFRRAWLHEFFSAQSWYVPRDTMDTSKLTDLDRQNAAFIARYEAAIPRIHLNEHLDRLLQLEKTPEIRLERQLVEERLGVWTPGSESDHPSPLQDTARLDSLLTIEDLNDLSRRDLALLRNMIYARRHRVFDSEDLTLYFSRYEWYAPDTSYSDDRLTAIDGRNINLIRSVEDEIGGPMDREERSTWFGGA